MADDDGVVIRLRDVYDIARRTEGKVDLLTLAATESKTTANDHETRLRSVERRVWAIPSLAACISAAALGVSLLTVSGWHK